ncbi:MAG: DUF2309 domain-containing protein [Nitrospiria bacterium]
MEKVSAKGHSDASRMALRGLVKLASEANPRTWPIHTFNYQNPLHDIESLPFEDALRQGKDRFGGSGYLSNEHYRNYLRAGRIHQSDLDRALEPLVTDSTANLKDRKLKHREVVRAHFEIGFTAPSWETLKSAVENDPHREMLLSLTEYMNPFFKPMLLSVDIASNAASSRGDLGTFMTLSTALDRIFEMKISQDIDAEMIKWCTPFLDEGHAPWEMPHRDQGFYMAWKTLAALEGKWGVAPRQRNDIEGLPHRPEDAVLNSLSTMGIPESQWESYLGLHLSALPGWTAIIKWRSEHQSYPWQAIHRIDLVQYLAVRLWYEVHWVTLHCRKLMGIGGTLQNLCDYIQAHPEEIFMRQARAAKRLPADFSDAVDRLSYRGSRPEAWLALADRYAQALHSQGPAAALSAAWRLVRVAESFSIDPQSLLQSKGAELKRIVDWLDAHPESSHGPHWLKAFEGTYQKSFLDQLKTKLQPIETQKPLPLRVAARPQAQAVFCIDVRSEPFRRHLEKTGAYETFGFAGFFTVFIRYLGFGSHREVDLFPAVAKEKHVVSEIPRPFQEAKVGRHRAGLAFMHGAHTLLHDLKENVVTPYVMVESIGWFFGIPLVGKTLFPKKYRKWGRGLQGLLSPAVLTTLTLDKLLRETVERMIASEQRIVIKEALQDVLEDHKKIASELIESLRKMALSGAEEQTALMSIPEGEKVARLFGAPDQLNTFVETLRNRHHMTEAWASARMERITRTGLSFKEQVHTVETALKMMGLTKNYARLVLFCAHGGTSENNPYEAALDCGACGGNPGHPNARVLATLANRPAVREALKKNGIVIPEDTVFMAAQHDTTTDEVRLCDLEDVPQSHKNDVDWLLLDLIKAGTQTRKERCARFPDLRFGQVGKNLTDEVHRRSASWSQVLPEWGLSGNAAIVISRNESIRGLDLSGRVFLHSYYAEEDPAGRMLEMIMTGPLIVAQWINMGYYFSTTDNAVYGSGSKVYHNVVGRIGIMYGATGDLCLGLPLQSVGAGPMPYHEAMRLLVVIEAPRKRIDSIISRHPILKDHLHNRWVHLIALDTGRFYRYLGKNIWREDAPPFSDATDHTSHRKGSSE